MVVSVTGIVINSIMLLIILFLLVLGLNYQSLLHACQTTQSPFCYLIHCPCDVPPGTKPQAPCFGYAKKPAGNPGEWNCSNAPFTVVNNNGDIV